MYKIEDYSHQLANDIASSVNGIKISTDRQILICAGLFDIVHEHHRAVLILLEHGLFGSASALLRSIFESYVRGMWFMTCATEEDVERFSRDKFNGGKFGDLLNEVIKATGDSHNKLLDIKEAGWRALNSYSHGGFVPVGRRFNGDKIEASYSIEELRYVERMSGVFAVLATIQIAELSGDETLLKEAESIAVEFNKRQTGLPLTP